MLRTKTALIVALALALPGARAQDQGGPAPVKRDQKQQVDVRVRDGRVRVRIRLADGRTLDRDLTTDELYRALAHPERDVERLEQEVSQAVADFERTESRHAKDFAAHFERSLRRAAEGCRCRHETVHVEFDGREREVPARKGDARVY
jgi:hypothetical protein